MKLLEESTMILVYTVSELPVPTASGLTTMMLSEMGKPWLPVPGGKARRAVGGKAEVGAAGHRIPLWPMSPWTPP